MADMTLTELATHKNMVAVDGKIYQMTSSSTWSHNGHTGGKDLSDKFHGEHSLSKLSGKTVIGNLIEETQCNTITCSFTIGQ